MTRTDAHRGSRGFTLTELLITLAISFILMAAVYQFFIRQQHGYSTQEELSRVQQQARTAQDVLVRAIQQAGAYSPNADGTTISLRGPVVASASDRYLTIQYDDPYRTADLGVITEEEVVTFVVSDEIPSAAPGANDWPSDDPAGGATTVRMWFDQNRVHGVEATEFFDVSIPTTLKGPPYTLYRVTPDKDAPTTASALHAEPIASGVDNLVFRYFDQNGAPIPRDAATGAAVPPPYVLTPAQRAQVRSIEVELALRTPSRDKAYRADFAVPDFTVATYTAGGTPQTGFTGFNDDGYRRRVFRTRITPRNLSANNCGNLLLYADNAQPRCLQSSTIRATVQNRYGQPVAGIPVNFTSDDGSFTNAAPTTDANGEVSTTLQYTGKARTIAVSASAVISCAPGGPDKYTLVSAIPVTFVPGDPTRVDTELLGGITEINTCVDPISWQFEAKTYDACDNSVTPEPGLKLRAVAANGATFGTIDDGSGPQAEVEVGASPQTFTVYRPEAGPYSNVVPADVDGRFTQGIGVDATAAPWFTPPLHWKAASTVAIKPWPPRWIAGWTDFIPAVAFDDCSTTSAADKFQVLDCRQNPVYEMQIGGPHVAATLVPDPAASALIDQGSLRSTANVGTYSPPGYTPPLAIANADPSLPPGGWYNITYTTPAPCGLSPQWGMPTQIQPKISLKLVDGATVIHEPTPTKGPTVRRCAGCDIQATPSTMTECSGTTTITVSGCQLAGQKVTLTVTGTGGRNGYFSSTGNTSVQLTFAGNNPSTATATLKLGTARDKDTLTVRASYTNTGGTTWQCDELQVPISSECQRLQIYSDASYSRVIANLPGNDDCLARIQDIYVEVNDCQDAGNLLRRAVTVYAVAQDGAWLDKEEINLVAHLVSANGAPLVWRSERNLPVVQSPTFHLDNDGALQYPPGKSVKILVQYQDPTDPNDPANNRFIPLTAPVDLSNLSALAQNLHACQKLVTLTAPLPICFPNAITSGGGGGWNGNFKVHWGDVVIRGDADPAATPKRITKSASAALDGSVYSGTGNSDRFFDIYVGFSNPANTAGGNLLNIGVSTDLQPLKADGLGNYFQRISYQKITEMIALLDYDTMKELAKDRGCYWYTLPGGNIVNTATGVQGSLEQVLNLTSGPGTTNAFGYNGKYIFVDTFGTATQAPTTTGVDVNDPATLPSFTLGGIYTEGIIYITGSVDYRSGGGGRDITITSPPRLESRYDHNTATFTENDLPIRPDTSQSPVSATLTDINMNGGVYIKGVATFSGSPKIFGAISAENGFGGNGTPEIWYNYSLNVSDQGDALCVFCCDLDVVPGAWTLRIGDSVALRTTGAAGAVQWSTEDSAVATVDSSGSVTAMGAGTTRIKAVDQNNCPAWTTITVLPSCFGFAVSPSIATVGLGGTQNFTASPVPAGTSIQWSSSNPAVALVFGTGANGSATGLSVGVATTVTVNAHDANSICPDASAVLTVNPPACSLGVTVSPASELVGQSVVTATAAGARGAVTWSSSGPATVNASGVVTGTGPGTATVTATDSFFAGGTCRASASVAINCPTITVTGLNTVAQGQSITLTASGGTAPYTWSSSAPANATFTSTTATTGTLLGVRKNRTTIVTATDAHGCASAGFTVSITP